jgi:hypothetical protein
MVAVETPQDIPRPGHYIAIINREARRDAPRFFLDSAGLPSHRFSPVYARTAMADIEMIE